MGIPSFYLDQSGWSDLSMGSLHTSDRLPEADQDFPPRELMLKHISPDQQRLWFIPQKQQKGYFPGLYCALTPSETQLIRLVEK